MAAEVDTTVIASLRRLPARQREVVVLRVLLNLDTVMTARVLGLAPGTVMSHLSRAVAALRSDLPAPRAHREPNTCTDPLEVPR
jgi:DNA-directed RNA polymerase specialized sigma24 family protein